MITEELGICCFAAELGMALFRQDNPDKTGSKSGQDLQDYK
jgi:hypothetical protein